MNYNSQEGNIFTNLVDELVKNAEFDLELKEAIEFLDLEAQKKGISFYDVVFERLYKYDAKTKAKEWLNSRN
jgi:hypothetical protein